MYNIKSISSTALIAVTLLAGCSAQESDYATLEEQVLNLHDEVMPKMDNIMDYQIQLKKKISVLDSLEEQGISGNNLASQRIKANELINSLTEADSLMMDWMYQYSPDSAKAISSEAAINYLKGEETKMKVVKEKTEKSLSDAKAFLESN